MNRYPAAAVDYYGQQMPVESQVILMEVIAMLDDGASTRGKITPQGGTLADGRTITEAILGIEPDERNRLKVAW